MLDIIAGSENREVPRLTRDEFSCALRKGQGRAAWHVRRYGLDGIADLVLQACLHNLSYDAQCEPSRADWLWSLVRGTAQEHEFRLAILAEFATATESWDVDQLGELLREFAENGDDEARQQLRERALRQASYDNEDETLLPDVWIKLAGPTGLLDLARLYGRRLQQDPQDFVPDHWIPRDESGAAFRDLLLQQARTEPDVRLYVDHLEQRGQLHPRTTGNVAAVTSLQRECVRQSHDVASILRDARNRVGEGPSRYMQFGRVATSEELQEILTALLQETNDDVRVRLLWVFRRATLPHLPPILLDWADDAPAALRAAAIAALSQVTDPRIAALARAKLQRGCLEPGEFDVLEMFLKNYEPADAQTICAALTNLEPGFDDVHTLGSDLLDVVAAHPDCELAPALRWVYERTPCGNCRLRAVEALVAREAGDDELWRECQLDAIPKIRDLGRAKLIAPGGV